MCYNPDCVICSCLQPTRLPARVFDNLSLLPDPLLGNSKEHYKYFHELYATGATENDRSSFKFPLSSSETDKVNKFLVSQRVRSAIKCTNCLRPRCIYAASKLDHNAFILLRRVQDEESYICGLGLFQDGPYKNKQ